MKSFTCYTGKRENKWYYQINEWLLHQDDQTFVITVKPVKSKRSDAQRRFYWGVLLPALVEYGKSFGQGEFANWTSEDYHEGLKEKYLRKINEKTRRMWTRSTTALTVAEFSSYIDTIINDILVFTFNGNIMEKDRELYNMAQGIKQGE